MSNGAFSGDFTAFEQWLAQLDIQHIERLFGQHGCTELLIKRLADRQDNDKNQIYVGSDLSQLAKIPSGTVEASSTASEKATGRGKTKFTAAVNFAWMSPNGQSPAPNAKLIYYPQYPEVRLSGLIQGSTLAPRHLYARTQRGQEAGRYLILGTNPTSDRVLGLLLPPESRAIEAIKARDVDSYGVFKLWPLSSSANSSRSDLLDRLADIHAQGWVSGRRLNQSGVQPYAARNAGGYTLEALLGVAANGQAEPDYLGWEMKAHKVTSFLTPARGPLTLMTPQPSSGLYVTNTIGFLRAFGSAVGNPPHRYNFTGIHRVGEAPHPVRGTQLRIRGWDGDKALAVDGALELVDAAGSEVAAWPFTRMVEHWKRKHAQACYVPYLSRQSTSGPGDEYWFSNEVRVCSGTGFVRLLGGFGSGQVYYDPGVKMELDARGVWHVKHRNQFRVRHDHLGALYDSVEDLIL